MFWFLSVKRYAGRANWVCLHRNLYLRLQHCVALPRMHVIIVYLKAHLKRYLRSKYYYFANQTFICIYVKAHIDKMLNKVGKRLYCLTQLVHAGLQK